MSSLSCQDVSSMLPETAESMIFKSTTGYDLSPSWPLFIWNVFFIVGWLGWSTRDHLGPISAPSWVASKCLWRWLQSPYCKRASNSVVISSLKGVDLKVNLCLFSFIQSSWQGNWHYWNLNYTGLWNPLNWWVMCGLKRTRTLLPRISSAWFATLIMYV